MHQRSIKGLSRAAVRALLEYNYPGNVRELENIIERGVVLADENEPIGLSDLFLSSTRKPGSPKNFDAPQQRQQIIERWLDEHPLEELIDRSVNRALTRSDGNISKAARLLGITRRQLEHRQKKILHGALGNERDDTHVST
uniref:helix-turn-helix domain-containing protein n=1 Tax=Pseudomonas fluorescens TaxID=294 RepID=UPI001F1DDB46|nr:helix-turn-helix domain-containing protein [Pseudomonas fluorescens]